MSKRKRDFEFRNNPDDFCYVCGPSDGLGRPLKRLVSRANLKKEADQQIQTPEKMYKWAKDNLRGINCHFVSNEQIQQAEKKLSKRFKDASLVQGCGCHAAIPISSDKYKSVIIITRRKRFSFEKH
ncbi:unnamed protein product [Brassicogethes aeneus]|uniref:Uncharacterized protein n=1 Tax=Brassicogethes aeneus TaxID=1431903 RepID=A0A9P0AZY1_BRAAE|nr:unnamed protein product [Brassicogethes aeneus]